jgi:thymidylate kinase
MKIVLAFEGMDGSGKTSLAIFSRRLCEQNGLPFTLIGRREGFSSPLVGQLTKIIHDEPLAAHAETYLRIAREYLRAGLASQAAAGVVVLDRFVISLFSLVRIHGLDPGPIEAILKDLVARAHLHATVMVSCPFDTARSRVTERNLPLTARGVQDDRFLRKLAALMDAEFSRGLLTGQQWLVDNSGELKAAEDQLAAYLYPYIQRMKTQRTGQ